MSYVAFPKDTWFFSRYFGERSEWKRVAFLAVTDTLEQSGKVGVLAGNAIGLSIERRIMISQLRVGQQTEAKHARVTQNLLWVGLGWAVVTELFSLAVRSAKS